MRPTPPPAPSVVPAGPAPLVTRNAEGELLTRRAEVEAEIGAALALDPAAWLRMATSSHRGALSSEALVHLCRHLRTTSTKRQRLLGDLLLALEARVTRIAQKFAQGFDEVTTEEIVQEVGQKVLELVLATHPDRAAEFLEASFGAAVARWTLKAVYKRRHMPSRGAVAYALRGAERRSETPQLYEERRDDDADGDDGGGFALPGSKFPTPEALLLQAESLERCPEPLRVGLAAIRDPRHREALILHHLEGWPIADKDPETLTLSKRFRVSDRQIRTWIATAFAEMRQAIGEKS